MKEQPFTGHRQDTSVVVTINHCYQYRSWKEGETQDSNEGRQNEEREGEKKKCKIQTNMRAIRPQG